MPNLNDRLDRLTHKQIHSGFGQDGLSLGSYQPITLGYAEVTANQGSIIAEVDLTGLSVTVTIPAGRRIRILGHVSFSNTTADNRMDLNIKESTTVLQRGFVQSATTGTNAQSVETIAVVTPTAGTHTYKLSAARATGVGTVTMEAGADFPAFILVEDITGSSQAYAAASVPVGQLAYAELATSYTIGSAGGSADVPGLSVNVAVQAGRVLRITGYMHLRSTVATDVLYSRINIDGTDYNFAYINELATNPNTPTVQAVVSLAAGAHTIKLRGARQSGTGSLSVYTSPPLEPSFILVEDITPTPAPASGAPGSTLAYAEVVANQGTFTAETDLTGLAVTVTVPTGRRIRISTNVLISSTVANDTMRVSIKEGATLLQLGQDFWNATGAVSLNPSVVISPAAGTHTYKLTGTRVFGTGNATLEASATYPAFILVEDITGTTYTPVVGQYNPATCRLNKAAVQSIANATKTPIIFDLEIFDPSSMHDIITNNTRITFVTPGLYLVGGELAYGPNATGFRMIIIRLNGATEFVQDARLAVPATDWTICTLSTIYKFNAGDYIELLPYQTSGGALDIQSSAATPIFWATWIGTGN